jgi:hypothetical protein
MCGVMQGNLSASSHRAGLFFLIKFSFLELVDSVRRNTPAKVEPERIELPSDPFKPTESAKFAMSCMFYNR